MIRTLINTCFDTWNFPTLRNRYQTSTAT